MPTVTQIVTQIAPISQFLASNDIVNGALFGARNNPLLALQLYITRLSVKYRYDYEDIEGGNVPSQSLVSASNWLYQLCDKYGLYALSLVESGGVIPGITPVPIGNYSAPVSSSYTATVDGETDLQLTDVNGNVLPSGSQIIWVQKSTTPLPLQSIQYRYSAPILTLLDGISMSAEEILSFIYVVPA